MSTIVHRLAAWADESPNSIAQTYKQDGKWKPISAREFCDRVYWLALYLESRGMTGNDIGTILSYNCPEWVHFELACLLLGAKSVGLYPNSTAKDIHYILNRTQSRFFAVQNQEYYRKTGIEEENKGLSQQLSFILSFDSNTSFSPNAVSYETAIRQGQRLALSKGCKKLSEYLARLDGNAPAFIIFTSGTTGNPKGALLSHDNIMYAIDIGARQWKLEAGEASLFSFLPLCHIAEKLQNLGAGIGLRYTVNYCSKFENVSVELPEVQPKLLLCVPRVWEKMMEGVQKKIKESSSLKKFLAEWAFQVGEKMARHRYEGTHPRPQEKIEYQLADRLILRKVRHALGLSRAKALVSGAAALPTHVNQWFRHLGLEIGEVYGQTESSGMITLTERGRDCLGSVGKAPEGTDFKLAPDGEMLTRGRHVFKGYFQDDKATAQVLEDGWLHTGDLGEWDARGYIRIKGRKREILKTSGGKMVAPLPIEDALKASPLLSQVCVVGDGRKFVTALMTLSEVTLAELQSQKSKVLEGRTVDTPAILNEIQAHVDKVNANLASYEQVKKFAVLSREFSVAEGEMTPTLKMKRDVIEARFRDVIDHLYEGNGHTNGHANGH